MSDDTIKIFPIQGATRNRKAGQVCETVYMRAYEVYCRVYGPQEALVTGGCRGGFSRGELVAFLYARSFPANEWQERTDEAFREMNID